MAMTQSDVEQFAAAAVALFAGSQELSDAFPMELGRAKEGIDEVTAELVAARLAVSSTKIKKDHEDAERALQVLYERNRSAAARVSERLSATLDESAARDPGEIVAGGAKVSTSAAIQAGLGEQVANLREFELATAQFFLSMTVATLDSSVGRCTDTCEAFLGRQIGSHEYTKRASQVAKAFVMDLAGVVTKFVLVGTMLEAIRQLRYSPQAEGQQARIRNAQGAEKLELFTEEVAVLGQDAMDYVDGMIDTSINAVEESQTVPPFRIFTVFAD
jgi:hypothetical protein